MEDIRKSIQEDKFLELKKEFYKAYHLNKKYGLTPIKSTRHIPLKLSKYIEECEKWILLPFLFKWERTILKKDLYSLKAMMDSSEVGGAPLLGVNKTVIKAHGSSNAKAVKNAVRHLWICVKNTF